MRLKEGLPLSVTVIATVVKMLESLPDPVQERVAKHLREYIEDLREGLQRHTTFKKTQSQIVAAARRAKQEIKETAYLLRSSKMPVGP